MSDLHPALYAVVVLAGLVVVSRVVRFVSLRVLTFLAERSRQGRASAWVVRLPRVGAANDQLELLRRDQRVRATAVLLSRIVNVLLSMVAVAAILIRLDVDVAWVVGSAGFLGAGLAFGAQHSLHDFITGLQVLLEDRFFEGDLIEIGEDEVRIVGTVERVGTFSTRLLNEHVTMHVANRHLTHVRNHSQRGHAVHLDLPIPSGVSEENVRRAVAGALRDVTPGVTPKIVVDRVRATAESSNRVEVEARLSEKLTTTEHSALADEVRRRLDLED